jgi:heme iron utilization protein
MNAIHTPSEVLATLRLQLASDPSVILEALAGQHGLSLQAVIECLPDANRAMAPGALAEAALQDIAGWGELTVLMHTRDAILECKGPLPAGRFAHGYYNIGAGSPISGHLRLDRCAALAFIRRPFMGADSCSVCFLNAEGEAMFKVFVGRDEKRVLRADQVERFAALRDRLCAGEAA